ncbi:Uma2 family endonuclease [Hymenobacter psoromatis]|uniref:Uma2 family endonuclease n=1 Tax=Hymenobacter psoromatis TaxID=1484116 RepID=UPI001CBC8DD6|nr:Uma2 family endonuclease [Hymenobacter psoromatis]
MPTTYEFPELPVLQGPVLAGLSDDEFFELCQANPRLNFERNAHLEIIIMPPAGSESSESCSEANYQLRHWNRPAQPGHVYDSSAGFKLPDNSVRSPDVAWLSQGKWAVLTLEQRRKFPPVCPEFMMEIKSPSDELTMLQAKMEAYLANGMELGFLLDVEAETAYVYRPGQSAETVQGYNQELSGEPVLPGFRLDLRPLRRAA